MIRTVSSPRDPLAEAGAADAVAGRAWPTRSPAPGSIGLMPEEESMVLLMTGSRKGVGAVCKPYRRMAAEL
ncbi:hypothetical protein WQQ_28970 [Hydrocarboniphaga effusa AP103]|uniref:Uncharacterized protein n=1 Tax=Hydrocarboniphaga effusa AP103 TaxID=1172194 RepID=I8T5U0_9GAMM|nr:hypothetical protein WQQ_28970 [Hydrocarboniphaga effusa AP103]